MYNNCNKDLPPMTFKCVHNTVVKAQPSQVSPYAATSDQQHPVIHSHNDAATSSVQQ